jgi:hypothetical protein
MTFIARAKQLSHSAFTLAYDDININSIKGSVFLIARFLLKNRLLAPFGTSGSVSIHQSSSCDMLWPLASKRLAKTRFHALQCGVDPLTITAASKKLPNAVKSLWILKDISFIKLL